MNIDALSVQCVSSNDRGNMQFARMQRIVVVCLPLCVQQILACNDSVCVDYFSGVFNHFCLIDQY